MGKRNTLVLCGRYTVYWDDLYHTLYYFNTPAEDQITSVIDRVLAHLEAAHQDLIHHRLYWAWNRVSEAKVLRNTQAQQCVPELMVTMTFGRQTKASDPRDKIYGLLGLIDISISGQIQPDYNLPLSTVYQTFATTCISTTNSLEILSQCHGYMDGVWSADWESVQSTMPSWSPDWSWDNHRHLCSPLEPSYRASGSSTTSALQFLGEDGGLLVCTGLKIGPVEGLGKGYYWPLDAMHVRGEDRRQWSAITEDTVWNPSYNIMHQSKSLNNPYHDENGIKDALWRSLVGNRDLSGGPAPDSYKCLLNCRPLIDAPLSYDHFFMKQNAGFMVSGKRFDYYFPRSSTLLDDTGILEHALDRMQRFAQFRRLMRTSNGFVGLAPDLTQKGDIVSIILGCSCPILLRPHGEHYKVVSSAYVHGIMDGEAMDWLGKEGWELENIVLC
jgi:hypothetical protein